LDKVTEPVTNRRREEHIFLNDVSITLFFQEQDAKLKYLSWLAKGNTLSSKTTAQTISEAKVDLNIFQHAPRPS
jgi:hypothetical protein